MADRRLANPVVRIKGDLKRTILGSVALPLGAELQEPGAPLIEGYESRFVASEGQQDDQFDFRIVLTHERVSEIARKLFVELLPQLVFATFEEFSNDAYRDVDNWLSEELVDKERLLQAWDSYGHFFVEDVRCGFGGMSYEPLIEVFVEEPSSINVVCGMDSKERVEKVIRDLGIEELSKAAFLDGIDHTSRDVIEVSKDELTMDDLDIKFSILESLGMQPTNRDEGEVGEGPVLYWVEVELDLSFVAKRPANVALASFGLTAEDSREALATVETALMQQVPGVLIARVLQVYRILEEDVSDEIRPERISQVKRKGIWYRGPIQNWY
ncbi:MAG: hypothetical protein V3W41_18485 [Planctomycetota bacterium]